MAEVPGSLSERLLALRELKGYTQPQLASRCGVSKATISRYEDDPDANFTRASIDLIAAGLEVDAAYLLGYDLELTTLPVRTVASRESLRRFLDRTAFPRRLRTRFIRIQDHSAAPITVQGWNDFWLLVSGFFGRPPASKVSLATSDGPDNSLRVRREMLRASLRAPLFPVMRSRAAQC